MWKESKPDIEPEPPKPFDRDILGKLIRSKRKEAGMTLPDFSTATGLSESYIATVELGKSNVTVVSLVAMIKPFDITLSELFGELGC